MLDCFPTAYPLTLLGMVQFTFVGVFLYMSVAYGLSVWLGNAGIVDVFWGAGFGLITLVWLAVKHTEGPLVWVFAGMMLLASIRLTWHIGQRFVHEYPKEDPRYTAFRNHFSQHPELMTFLVFQFQGLLMTIVSLPIYLGLLYLSTASVSGWQWAAVGVYLLAWLGESIADAQLDRFKKDPDTTGQTCRRGLWNYSRHPNYFCQWLLWVSYAVFVTPLNWPWGLLGWVSPVLMLHFLINVTGVKATEEHAVQSRADYAEYQKTTSMFVVWPFKPVPDFLK